jgi:FixJ family two-component response regulator
MSVSGCVHIVDDDASLRDTLVRLFSIEDIATFTYASADEFLEKVNPNFEPGCLLLDLRMSGMSGLELQQKISDTLSHWPIVFLSGHGQVHTAVEALKQGALEFLEKPIDNDILLDAVINALNRSKRLSARAEMRESLTKREHDVLNCLEYGMSIKEMADTLTISEKTVEFHRANVRKKVNVKLYRQIGTELT